MRTTRLQLFRSRQRRQRFEVHYLDPGTSDRISALQGEIDDLLQQMTLDLPMLADFYMDEPGVTFN